MILLALTIEEATQLAKETTDADVLDRICSQLRFAELFEDADGGQPEMVMFKNVGGQLSLSCVAYYHAAAADAAEDVFWQRLQDEAKRLPLFSESA